LRFLVHENLPATLAEALTTGGHDVLDVAASEYRGESDASLWKLAIDEERVLVTRDRDFPIQGASGRPPGIVLLRPEASMRSAQITTLFESALARIGLDALLGHVTVIEPGRARQRPYANLPT